MLEPGGFYCQRCSDDTQRDRTGPKTTIKLWLFSREAPYALLVCSTEDFSFDYELSVSLQSDFWMSEWVSKGSQSASFTHRWEKLWIPVRKVMKVQLNLLTTLCWCPIRSWWWNSTGIERFFQNNPFCSKLLRQQLYFQASKEIEQMKYCTLHTFLISLTFYDLNCIFNSGLLTCNRELLLCGINTYTSAEDHQCHQIKTFLATHFPPTWTWSVFHL